jgi:probable rRNA maturation factor
MISIEVEAEAWSEALFDVEPLATRAGRAALGTATGSVAILLTDDETVRDLNARFRGKDNPTNVLSFPAAPMPGAGPSPLGDIVLAFETCAAEAGAQGKSLSDHMTHLIVHGVLHLLGRDHEDDAEAETMEAEERAILAGLGIADPYRVIA